ncbi:ankyrin repeat-containing domain protein [Mycena olivaceomarginata]|nr:ankyrin repeat-containing domain protein [Mycena olivaceomarginata]
MERGHQKVRGRYEDQVRDPRPGWLQQPRRRLRCARPRPPGVQGLPDKKEKLRKWLKPMLHLIGSLSETAGEAAGVPVPFAKAGFVALGVLVQAAKNVSARYDSIIDLCELLHSFLERLRVYMSAQLSDNMREVVIRILAHLLSVFALVTKEIQHKRFGSYLRTLIGRTDVQDALKKLNDLIGVEQSMGVASAMTLSRNILDHLHGLVLADKDAAKILDQLANDLHKAMQSTKDASERVMQQLTDLNISTTDANERIMKDLRDLSRRHLDDSVRSWLKAPDARANHNTARSLHDGNTGNWLVRSFEYKSWKSTSSSLFWINGKPGAGKTVICSTVIEDMLALPGGVQAYFYFYYGEADKQSLRGMLSSIIFQLEEQLLDAPSPLLALFGNLGLGAHEPSIPELTACLKELIVALSARPIFIILDALDECSKPDELARVLGDLLQWGKGCVHVFVTSRPEDAVVKELRPLTTCELDLSSVIQDDISLYLGHVMSKEHPFRSWPQVHRDHALNHLLEYSNGMFRWVSCQLDDLRNCLLRDLQVTLNNLPTTLDATYERILSRIHATNKPHARRLFNWLAFSFRPLHVEELAQVLAINFINDASTTFEKDYIEADPREAISRVCLSLVHIAPDGTVQLVHFSVKEFFVSERIQAMPSVSLFWIEAEMAHTIIAASCLAYLLWVGRLDDIPDNMDEITVQYPLAEYSVLQYAVHTQFGRVSDNVRVMLESLFIEDSRQWMFWVSHNVECPVKVVGSPLYWAAKLGFLNIMRLLLDYGADVNAQGGRYGNAIQAAVVGGHLDLAQLLLEHGADVNAQGGRYGTVAIQAAAVLGNLDFARLLLKHGADVNAHGRKYGNVALQAVAALGHLELVQLLLEHGADINMKGKFSGTALQEASSRGHVEIVKLLVEKGADVNAQGNSYGTALQVAAFSGQLKIVQLLLSMEASQDAQGGDWKALQAAALGGWLDIVQCLLDRGADVNAHDPECPTALQAALYGGHIDIAQAFLDKGADVNDQGGEYPTALQSALYGGHINIAWSLLEGGTNVNSQGGKYPTALQSALYGGYIDIAWALLEEGANVNDQDPKCPTALQAALYGGHVDIAWALLEKGANVNDQGGEYPTALQSALYDGHINIAWALLERGANVNDQVGEYPTALQSALYGGHIDIAQALLEKGANVNDQGGEDPTALQLVISGGHINIAQALIVAEKAKVKAEDNKPKKFGWRKRSPIFDVNNHSRPIPLPFGEGG